jgi:hypothetical protein
MPRKDKAPARGWDRAFDDPILLLSGRQAVALRDAGDVIAKLPKAEHDAPERQAAIRALMLVVKHDGQTLLARIGIIRALYPPGEPAPRKKRAKNTGSPDEGFQSRSRAAHL